MPRKKKVQVSDPLSAFIEKQFQSMLRFEEELKEDRKAYRRDLERKEQREFMRIKRKHGNLERKNPNPLRIGTKKGAYGNPMGIISLEEGVDFMDSFTSGGQRGDRIRRSP